MSRRHHPTAAARTGILAALLVAGVAGVTACGDSGRPAPYAALPSGSTQAGSGQTSGDGGGQSQGSGSGSGGKSADTDQSRDQVPGCTADMDLVDTDFEMFGRTKKVMISVNGGASIRDGQVFHFSIAQNQFDACRQLSWIVLRGSNGSLSSPAGTGASSAEAVVFFLGDRLVAHPLPPEVHTVESVTRTAGDAVTVKVGLATGSTAEGVTEHASIDYVARDGRLVESSSTVRAGLLDGSMKLDFDAGPVPMDAPEVRLGNAHTS